jgi:ankyrin repeat protein
VIIVLDALDECLDDEFRDLARKLKGLHRKLSQQQSCGQMRSLLTFRPYEGIVAEFRELCDEFPYIRIPGEDESDAISTEVNLVIAHRVERLAREKELRQNVKDMLKNRLLEVKHRTYLWVYLVFDHLTKYDFKKTAKAVEAILATLPEGVNQAYEKILSKCGERSMVRKALSIMLAAYEPLTVMEMNVAVNVPIDGDDDDDDSIRELINLDLEATEDFESRLRSWCGLFVSVYQGKVYFLHQTAREFLLARPSPSSSPISKSLLGPSAQWHNSISARDAHAVLAIICVAYLDIDELWHVTDLSRAYQYASGRVRTTGGTPETALANYAANWWARHFRQGTDINASLAMVHSALKIYLRPLGASRWTRRTTVLGRASREGHNCVLKHLLDEGADIETECKPSTSTPLGIAVTGGHEDTVAMLLDRDANIEARDTFGSTPLIKTAKFQHHTHVVRLLLDRDADIEARDDEGDTPLATASASGNEATVRLLLDRGADIEAKNAQGQTPLARASSEGNEPAIRPLLERGADIEARDVYNQTPLMLAALNGWEGIVGLLLDAGADVEARNHEGATSLAIAIANHKEDVVIFLLDSGANVEARDHKGATPLMLAAARMDQQRTISRLLDSGAIEAVVVSEMLLERGADIEARDNEGRTALMHAASAGGEAIVWLLLTEGLTSRLWTTMVKQRMT